MGCNKTPIKIELTDDEREALEQVSRSLSIPHRDVVRAPTVLLIAGGRSLSAVGRFQFHFTPVHFSSFQRKRMRIPDFDDLVDLENKVHAFIDEWNQQAVPFSWTKKSFEKHPGQGRRCLGYRLIKRRG